MSVLGSTLTPMSDKLTAARARLAALDRAVDHDDAQSMAEFAQ